MPEHVMPRGDLVEARVIGNSTRIQSAGDRTDLALRAIHRQLFPGFTSGREICGRVGIEKDSLSARRASVGPWSM